MAAGGLFSAGCGSVTRPLREVSSSLTNINQHLDIAITNQTQAIQQQQIVIDRIQKTDDALEQTREKERAFVQRYVTGVYDLLGHVDAASTPQGEFALRGAKVFAADLARKLGTYQGPDRVDHQAIATGQITTKQVEESVRLSAKAWNDIQSELADLREKKIALNGQLEATTRAVQISQEGIKAVGGEIDALKRRITWERIWAYFQTPRRHHPLYRPAHRLPGTDPPHRRPDRPDRLHVSGAHVVLRRRQQRHRRPREPRRRQF